MEEREPAQVYEGLRAIALGQTPAKLGIEIASNEMAVFGLAMEQNSGDFTMMIVGFSTGDASIYSDVGPGVIGGFAHESVRRAARHLVELAQNLIGSFAAPESYPRAVAGQTGFFALTNVGVLTVFADSQALNERLNPLWPIFHAAHKVFAELRTVSEARTRKESLD